MTRQKIKLFAASILLITSINVSSEPIEVLPTPIDRAIVEIICINGFVFAVAIHGGRHDAGRGVSIIQVYQTNQSHLPPQPSKCGQ